ALAARKSISTRTITRFTTRSGICTPPRWRISATRRHCWNGTATCRGWRRLWPRPRRRMPAAAAPAKEGAMPKLPDIQHEMLRRLLQQEGAEGLGLAPERNFGIHRNNARLLLQGMLQDVFPVTAKLVGEDFFAAAARDFMQAF